MIHDEPMGLRNSTGIAVEMPLTVLVLSLLAGQVLGRSVLVGYVTSDSMSPTLHAGDGYR